MATEPQDTSDAVSANIIVDFGPSEVAKGDPVVWPGFRIFTAIPEGKGSSPTRSKRRTNAFGNPVFDYTAETLFDYPTIIAHRLDDTNWMAYNRLCSVHVPSCPFKCWHCFNDARPDVNPSVIKGSISAKELFNKFLHQREFDASQAKYTNVIRITGGEPFTEPNLILEIAKLIHNHNEKNPDSKIFLWTETNIVAFTADHHIRIENIEDYLPQLAKYNDSFALHPCFHGLSDDELFSITNTAVSFSQLIEALRLMVEAGIDIYPTLHANICDPTHLENVFNQLINIHPNLPLRIALIEIDLNYEAVKKRMDMVKKAEDREQPHLSSKYASLYEWDRLLRKAYGIGYGVLPRHLVSLANSAENSKIYSHVSANNKVEVPDIKKTCMLLQKGAERPLYRQMILTTIGLPDGFVYKAPYDQKWIAQDILEVAKLWSDNFNEYPVVECYAGNNASGEPVVCPVRNGELHSVTVLGDTIAFNYKLGSYPKIAPSSKSNLFDVLWPVFGLRAIAPIGKLFAVLSPMFDSFSMCDPSDDALKTECWEAIVKELSCSPNLENSVFCRLSVSSRHKVKVDGNGSTAHSYIAAGSMDELRFRLQYRIPNFSKIEKSPVLKIEVTNTDLLQYIGPSEITLSKYDELELHFKCGSPERVSECEIHISRKDSDTEGPFFRLPVRILGRKRAIGNTASNVLATVASIFAGVGGALYVDSFTKKSPHISSPCVWIVVICLTASQIVKYLLAPATQSH